MQLNGLERIYLFSCGYLTKVFIKIISIWDNYKTHRYPTSIYNDIVRVIFGFKAELSQWFWTHNIHWSRSLQPEALLKEML